MFDIPAITEVKHEWDVALPLDDKAWGIGLIVGGSGSGKSVIASEIFKDFKNNSSIFHSIDINSLGFSFFIN